MIGTHPSCLSRKPWQTLLGTVRVSVVIGVLLLVAGTWFARAAQAAASEALRGFGAELMRWQEVRPHSSPRRLRINGLELNVVTASTEEDVSSALDRFQEYCRGRSGLSVPEALRGHLPSPLEGTFRQDGEEEGVLACLDTGRPLSVGEALERFERFIEQGDLSAWGEMRYLLAQRTGSRTTLLMIWTEGPAPVLSLFPEDGDAAGSDPQGIPRPSGSKRLLSAAELGQPYTATVYRVSGREVASLLDWYTSAFGAEGWTVQPAEGKASFWARRGERTIFVRVKADLGSEASVATILELS